MNYQKTLLKNRMVTICLFLLFSLQAFSQVVTKPSKENGTIISDIPGAVLLRGPYLQVPTDSTMVIRWRTDLAVTSIVKYGISPQHLDKKVIDKDPETEHIIKIEGLKQNAKYYYSIGYFYYSMSYKTLTEGKDIKLQGNEHNYFYTLPEAGKAGDYRVGFFGDPGSLSTLQHQVRDQFLKYLGNKELNAWVILGDIAYDHGLDAEYQAKFFNPYKEMLEKYPLFTLPGNHDYHDNNKVAYMSHSKIEYFQDFSMPLKGESGGVPSHNKAFYSFDIGNIHFLSLDSFGAQDSTFLYDTSGVQMQWVKRDLDANKNKEWVIVMWHHPPYTMGSHNSDNQFILYKIRQNILPILDRYGVDMVICGHSHVYERSKLMYGYYGMEADFDSAKYDLSYSSGLYNGRPNSCPYIKESKNRGTVYVVEGGSSELGGVQKSWPHNAMYYSNATYGGALLLEVRGNRLDMRWICQDGIIRDRFTMMKNANEDTTIYVKRGQSTTLTASYLGDYEWNNKEHSKSIKITPHTGSSIFSVHDKYNCIKDTFNIIVSDQNN